MAHLDNSVAIVGAGDYIGTAIAKKFASEGYLVVAGRRNGYKLEPLVAEIGAAGGRISARSLDAREPEDVTAFLAEADALAPLALTIFNVGANVNFPILETTDRVFRKVWEMACFAGFVTGRESARLMLEHGEGKIFFTGATADNPPGLMPPEAIADAYWQLFQQPETAWTFEQEIRPYGETW